MARELGNGGDTEGRYMPTTLAERDTLTEHFAHEGLLATRRDHLNLGTSANLQKYLDSIENSRDEMDGTDGVR
jgi:hypothetical protein